MLDQGVIGSAKAETVSRPSEIIGPAENIALRRRLLFFTIAILFVCLCFAKPLLGLVSFCLHSELYSYSLLVPFISLYLIWLQRRNLPGDFRSAPGWALLPFLAGGGFLLAYWLGFHSRTSLAAADYRALMTASFYCFIVSACFGFLGTRILRSIAFPLAFLIFMVPFPTGLEVWIESLLQRGSAEAAYGMLTLSGTPVFRDGLAFQMPGISIQVAPECSGIHSSIVLFMTSLLAGHLLLRRPWSRLVLVLAVIPMAMLRNGFRIFLLAQLCVHLDPSWIHSDLHRHGGPLFFLLSLVPFFLLLFALRRLESPRQGRPPTENSSLTT